MKKWAQPLVDFKMAFMVIWIAMLVLYMLSKTILGVYEVSFLTLIELLGVAIVITCIEYLYESKLVIKTHSKAMIIIEGYLLISLVIIGFNALFGFYLVQGISYLYLEAFITFAYFGAMFGFYLMDSMGVQILNKKLTSFQSKTK